MVQLKPISFALKYASAGILFFYEDTQRKASFGRLTTVKNYFQP